MDILKFAIDLLWVRHNQVGGIESYIRNVMDGFLELKRDFEIWLITSEDNVESFESYTSDQRFHIYRCSTKSANVGKRIFWQNMHLGRILNRLGINLCFEPYYCKPILGTNKIKFVTTIHDLQAIHYPEYFSKGKVVWMKLSWWNAIRTSKAIIATSEFVKNDIISVYHPKNGKVKVINIPIVLDFNDIEDLSSIEAKYNIIEKGYYFSVSSLLPHKNIGVLLETMKMIKDTCIDIPSTLIVSGVGGKSREELQQRIKNYGLENEVRLTDFIDNAERNALMKYSRAFLFPSVFEGFGMPPLEAMMIGATVITTRKASIEEVTQGKATYVEDPYSAKEWVEKIRVATNQYDDVDYEIYDKKYLGAKLLNLFEQLYKEV